jgi:hypothetical protein
MPRLDDRQRDFAAALLDPDLPPPEGLIGPDGEPSAQRFTVYRNNVVVGLIDALADAFPAVRRIVGEEFFRTMARIHAVREPPASPILLDYGANFPEFIAKFPPAAELPYLADVARIERAWRDAYYAAEAEPIGPAAFAGLDFDELPDLRLRLHPSLRLVRSQHPALTIWDMNVREDVHWPLNLRAGGEDALIVRPAAEVEARSLPEGGFEFVEALFRGETVLASSNDAIGACSGFDIAANLSGLLEAGAIVGFARDEGPSNTSENR